MARWSDFESAAPDLAATARSLLHRDGSGKAMLATVRGDEPPHINPISVGIVDGELCAFIFPSGKLTDADRRAAAIAAWPFEPDDEYRLFAFDIETVLVGRRDSPNEWPPRYSRWRAPA